MPIRINLLAEAQAAEETRRKDPVKRAIWIGGFVVFVIALCAATLQFKIMAARSEVNTLQASWKAIEKSVQEVNSKRNGTHEVESRLSALDQFTTNRLLWAAALNALQFTPVDGVQLVRLKANQVFTLNEGTKGRTNGTATEKTVMILEGRDYSANPGEHVPKLKEALAHYPYFEATLQKTNKIQLTSQTAPQTEGGRGYVGFELQMYFQEKERRLYE